MKLDTFLLADAAAAFEGQLYVHGGGISRINAPVIPWNQPQLSIVLRLRIEEGDRDDMPSQISLMFLDPTEASFLPTINLKLPTDPPPKAPAGEETFIQLALNLGTVVFGQQGLYKFELMVGNELMRSLHLPVVAPTRSQANEESASNGGEETTAPG